MTNYANSMTGQIYLNTGSHIGLNGRDILLRWERREFLVGSLLVSDPKGQDAGGSTVWNAMFGFWVSRKHERNEPQIR